jgi:septum formation protein
MDTLEGSNTEALKLARNIGRVLPRVLLASRSPRRRRMLTERGIEHTAVISGVDDSELVRGGVTAAEWVAALAYFKAAAAHEQLDAAAFAPGELVVLGADTVVRKGDRIIGQPVDAADAERIVRLLQNGEHDVLTGVAFIDAGTGKRDMWVDRSRVRVGEIGDERIGAYLVSTDWRGKAGAYNLSERLEAGWPIEFEGDPGTIMGLPMERLVDRLVKFRESCVGATTNN